VILITLNICSLWKKGINSNFFKANNKVILNINEKTISKTLQLWKETLKIRRQRMYIC